MRGSPVKLIVSLFLAILMVAFPLAWTAGGGLPTETRFIAYISIFCAFAYLLKSGANELTPATWFVIMAAYPILTPLITIDLLGYPYYASGLRQYQTLESMTVPVVLGGLGTLFIALNVSKKKLACPRGLTQHLGETTWAGRTAMILFVLACLALLAANFLDAPPSLLGLGKTHYRDIKETRDDSLNFASSLVMVFAATALLSLIVLKVNARATRRTRYIAGGVFLGICMFIVMWQILSASRIEAIGILLILMFTFGNRAPRSIRRAAMIGVFLIFAGVGYLRTVLTLQDYLSRNYVSWPGGPENVFKTYSFGLNAIRDGDVPLQYGQTYIDLLARLPPSFFGIQRPPRAYDLLAEKAPLIGGEYFLTEPYLNFMGIGVAVALVLLVWMLNASIRSLSAFYFQPDRVFSGILAATLLMFSFRLFWYGFEHTLKTMTAAVVVGLPLLLLVTAARASRRGRTKRRRVPAPMPAPSPAE